MYVTYNVSRGFLSSASALCDTLLALSTTELVLLDHKGSLLHRARLAHVTPRPTDLGVDIGSERIVFACDWSRQRFLKAISQQ